MSKTIAFAADHAGFEMKELLKSYCAESHPNAEILDLGTDSDASVNYPDFGKASGEAVTDGRADFAIAVCGSGIGISIAANRISGARAALCHDANTATLSRQHNDANILALGSRIITLETAKLAMDAFLNTEFEGGRHQHRVEMLG